MDFILKIRMGEIDNPTTVRKAFSELQDGSYMVTIKPLNRRSQNQNAYIHGILFPEVQKALYNLGFDEVRTMQDAKEICKMKFLKRTIVNEKTGEVVEIVRNTSELTKQEMAVFIEDVLRFASDQLGHYISSPGSQTSAF